MVDEKVNTGGRRPRNWVIVPVRLRPEQAERLRRLCEREDIPFSTLLRRAADQFLVEAGL